MIFKEGFKNVTYPCSSMIKYDGTFQVIRNNVGISKRGVKRHLPFLYTPTDKVFYAELIRGEGKNRYEEFASNSKEQYKVVLLDKESTENYMDRVESMRQYKNEWTIIPNVRTFVDKAELQRYFDQVVMLGYEGIVAKCNGYRVKIKKDYTIDLIVKGIAKGRSACLLGSRTENYCFASMLGKISLLEAISDTKVIKTTKDAYLFEPKIIVEIKHYGIIRNNGKISLRNPVILRNRKDKPIAEVKCIV